LASCPLLDLRAEPELDSALSEVKHRLRHVDVALLVLENCVAVREAENLGYALRIDEVLCRDLWCHNASLHR